MIRVHDFRAPNRHLYGSQECSEFFELPSNPPTPCLILKPRVALGTFGLDSATWRLIGWLMTVLLGMFTRKSKHVSTAELRHASGMRRLEPRCTHVPSVADCSCAWDVREALDRSLFQAPRWRSKVALETDGGRLDHKEGAILPQSLYTLDCLTFLETHIPLAGQNRSSVSVGAGLSSG